MFNMEANGDAHELPVKRAMVRAGKYGAVNLDRNTQGQASAPSPAHSKANTNNLPISTGLVVKKLKAEKHHLEDAFLEVPRLWDSLMRIETLTKEIEREKQKSTIKEQIEQLKEAGK